MRDRNKLHRVKTEGTILSQVDHPFVATLYSAFQTETHVYFVMDFCPGGELYEVLQKQPGKRFNEDTARFYAAEVWRQCKLDPGLKAHLVSNFDCEKGHNSAFNFQLFNPLFCLSLRRYVEVLLALQYLHLLVREAEEVVQKSIHPK